MVVILTLPLMEFLTQKKKHNLGWFRRRWGEERDRRRGWPSPIPFGKGKPGTWGGRGSREDGAEILRAVVALLRLDLRGGNQMLGSGGTQMESRIFWVLMWVGFRWVHSRRMGGVCARRIWNPERDLQLMKKNAARRLKYKLVCVGLHGVMLIKERVIAPSPPLTITPITHFVSWLIVPYHCPRFVSPPLSLYQKKREKMSQLPS